MSASSAPNSKNSSATIGFEVMLWLVADKLRNNIGRMRKEDDPALHPSPRAARLSLWKKVRGLPIPRARSWHGIKLAGNVLTQLD